MKKTIIKLIGFYKQIISPLWANSPFGFINSSCRFYPTCSDYAVDAVNKYGAMNGSLKAVGRVLRCNPLAKAGVDEA